MTVASYGPYLTCNNYIITNKQNVNACTLDISLIYILVIILIIVDCRYVTNMSLEMVEFFGFFVTI